MLPGCHRRRCWRRRRTIPLALLVLQKMISSIQDIWTMEYSAMLLHSIENSLGKSLIIVYNRINNSTRK